MQMNRTSSQAPANGQSPANTCKDAPSGLSHEAPYCVLEEVEPGGPRQHRRSSQRGVDRRRSLSDDHDLSHRIALSDRVPDV